MPPHTHTTKHLLSFRACPCCLQGEGVTPQFRRFWFGSLSQRRAAFLQLNVGNKRRRHGSMRRRFCVLGVSTRKTNKPSMLANLKPQSGFEVLAQLWRDETCWREMHRIIVQGRDAAQWVGAALSCLPTNKHLNRSADALSVWVVQASGFL